MLQIWFKVRPFLTRLTIKTLLLALIFAHVVHHVHGAYFHGDTTMAVALSLSFNLAHILVLAAIKPTVTWLGKKEVFDLSSFTIFALVFILSCMIAPPLELHLLARLFPATIGFQGFVSRTAVDCIVIVFTVVTRYRGEQ